MTTRSTLSGVTRSILAQGECLAHGDGGQPCRKGKMGTSLASNTGSSGECRFIFISAKAMTTMEFLQQEWINDGNFMNLGKERDPNVGLQEEGATFTIPKEPVRHRIHGIETFNVLRGGEYLFMPSLSALKWLVGLGG